MEAGKNMKAHKIGIPVSDRTMKATVLKPRNRKGLLPGILWMHGGGYMMGGSYMIHISIVKDIAEEYGAVVLSPDYTLANKKPYPAALNDCAAALQYMYDHSEQLGIDRNRIIVGGESAGGGLAAAVCIYARDHMSIPIILQLPLYPMLDCEDTDSSRDNHGYGWNTRQNHWGWSHYLGDLYHTDKVPPYASPSRCTDYRGLPDCYTYVEDGEPFHDETLTYVANLKAAGVRAEVDVFHGNVHCFDAMFWTENAREGKRRLMEFVKDYLR